MKNSTPLHYLYSLPLGGAGGGLSRGGVGGGLGVLYCWFSAMHTRVDIAFVSSLDKEYLLEVGRKIQTRIAEIESIANCFDPQSELSLYNIGTIAHVDLSPELSHILTLCDEWKEKTNGLFDVAYSGTINLSGFLKGYALDQIRPIIEEAGITNALINLGNSSILALGNQPGSTKGWHITLPPPSEGPGEVLLNECLTTSGNDSPDRRHIMNPLTGEMITGQRTVSVITPTGAEGEVMATVKFITEKN